MTTSWFLAPYRLIPGAEHPARYCAMDDYTALIAADGGFWDCTEVLGNYAICKVRASDATLATIAADADFTRIPSAWRLTDTLASLTAGQKSAIKNKVQTLGYSLAEIVNRFPNDLGTYTLGDVLRFAASRRRIWRYDSGTDTIICDGAVQPVRSVEDVDGGVP